MPDLHNNSEARESILRSIRSHLATSVPHDERETASHHVSDRTDSLGQVPAMPPGNGSLARMFKESLEAVDGHCVVVQNEAEIASELTAIISGIQQTRLRGRRIAISDVPMIERLMYLTDLDVDELTVTPNAIDLFGFDVGITTAQAAIAETGTLVLDAARERHRLISLVPPVHIAIVDAANIYQTLGETLSVLHKSRDDVSATITFITGPSRTADIELTLAIGVHGPQELHVIINEGPALRG